MQLNYCFIIFISSVISIGGVDTIFFVVKRTSVLAQLWFVSPGISSSPQPRHCIGFLSELVRGSTNYLLSELRRMLMTSGWRPRPCTTPRYICTYIFYIACSPYPPLFFFGLFWIQFGKPSGRVRELCILAFCFVCFGLVFWPLNLIPCLLETPLGNTHSNNHRWFNVLGLTGTLTERARKQLGIVQKQFSEITRQSWNIN